MFSKILTPFVSWIHTTKRNPYFWYVTALLLIATVLRLYPLGHGLGTHPDERHMVTVTNDLVQNGMNPKSFAYGSLPFYLCWFASQFLAILWPFLASYDGLFFVGRCCSVVFGVSGIGLTYFLARKLDLSRPFSFLAAALLAFNLFHLQLSRYFAVDIYLSTFSTLALLAFIGIFKSGSTKAYVCAGLALGLALATKVSALNLLLPFTIAALSDFWIRKKYFSWIGWAQTLSTLLVAAVTFILVEPFAIIDFATFRLNTLEQINMVRGGWRPPYTIQYENTAPFLYHLEQMLNFTMGPALLVPALLGIFLTLSKGPSRARFPLIILTAWTVGTFCAFAGLQVKFPRYLLPLYGPLCIFAAYTASRVYEYLKSTKLRLFAATPAIGIFIAGVFTSLCFLRIYSFDHAYETSSRWIYQHVPAGSKLLSIDWDDKLPLSLPGLSAYRYQFEGAPYELQLYHPDNQEKLKQLSSKLAIGDFLVIPTARAYGSIPRIPNEYPLTTNFFRLLFAEKLGYQLVQSFKARPGFGDWSWSDDLADESFSVYDHPKVLIFKNFEHLSNSEIEQRLQNDFLFGILPTREQMLLKDAGTDQFSSLAQQSSLFALILWILMLEVLLLLGAPLASWIFSHSPDSGLGLARVLGIASLGAISWIGASLNIFLNNRTNVWLTVASILAMNALIIAYLKKSRRGVGFFFPNKAKCGTELMFWFGFFLFVGIRAFHPDIYWGEKPMDFTFLNYFIRLETLPPQDPWAIGQTMHYYYFGSYAMALLHKLSGVDSAIGYNLCIATIAGLSLSAAFSLFISLGSRIASASIASLLIILASNLEVLYLFFTSTKTNFDLFWASTRLFKEPGITEYPLWALLFADLHAHLIALPLVLATLALAFRFFRAEHQALSLGIIAHRITCGLLLGILFLTNSWDAISYGILTATVLTYTTILHAQGARVGRLQKFWLGFSDLCRDSSLLAIGSIPLIAIYKLTSKANVEPHYGFNQSFEFNSLWQLSRHLGHFFIPLAIFFGCYALVSIRRNPRSLWSWARKACFILIASLLPMALGALAEQRQIENIPWAILIPASVLAALSMVALCTNRANRRIRVSAICALIAAYIIAAAEICFLMDHMNTIFKFYNAVWILLGVALGLILSTLIQLLFFSSKRALILFPTRAICFVIVGIFAVCSVGSIYNIWVMASFRRVPGPRPTLNGMQYLKSLNSADAAGIEFLRQNALGAVHIVEAFGPSYQNFTRVSMNTGLPTILGWGYHVIQRGTPNQSVRYRESVIQAIYSSENLEEVLTQLRIFSIKYIFLGEEENKLYSQSRYNQAGLNKFSQHPELFKLVFQAGDTKVFEVIS